MLTLCKLNLSGLARFLFFVQTSNKHPLVHQHRCYSFKVNNSIRLNPNSQKMATTNNCDDNNNNDGNAWLKPTEKEAISNDAESEMQQQQQQLLFGSIRIDPNHAFYYSHPSNLTFAIVNLRPLVPGHVLVIPRRVVPRLSYLTNDEYDDLWRSVRVVQNAIESYYGASSSNIAIQDGETAGQSVPHVHVHILPRKATDYYNLELKDNDQIYQDLQQWVDPRMIISNGDKQEGQRVNHQLSIPRERRDRTFEEMSNEAAIYRNLMSTWQNE